MAEALGTIAAITGLVEFSAAILGSGYGYIAKVTRAPKEIRSLLSEVASLELILTNLEDVASDVSDRANIEQTLESLSKNGTLEICKSALGDAQKAIRACERLEGNGKEIKNLGRRLLWPLKEAETRELMQRLRNLRETFIAALTIDSTFSLRRIEVSQEILKSDLGQLISTIGAREETDKRQKLYKWLCPKDCHPDKDLEAALSHRQSNTGEWLFDSEIFKSWLNTSNGLLWLSGIPGSGKTVLTSTVICKMKYDRLLQDDDTVTYFYCDHQDDKKQSLLYVLITLASQLFRSSPGCFNDVLQLFGEKGCDDAEPVSIDDYVKIIQAMSSHFSRIFVIIDALDEFENSKAIMTNLHRIFSADSYGAKFRALISSRNNFSMEQVIAPYATFNIALQENCQGDIATFVASEVKSRLSGRRQKVRDLEDTVVKEVVGRAEGLFLQAKLQIDYVCSLKTIADMKKAFLNIPSGLEPIYDKMLTQIVSSHSSNLQLVKNMFQWILWSFVPLTLDALAHAVAIHLEDLSIDDDSIADDIAELCGSFVNVERNSYGERIIKPAHMSVNEYFRSEHLASSGLRSFYWKFADIHLQLALICIKYLSFEELNQHFGQNEPRATDWELFFQKYPLYQYAATNWHKHLRCSGASPEVFLYIVSPHLQWFLSPNEQNDPYSLWKQAIYWLASERSYLLNDQLLSTTYRRMPPIFHMISFDLFLGFEMLIPASGDLDRKYENGHTLLTWSILTGRAAFVKRLLDLNANPNIHMRKGMTPLHFAAQCGNYEISTLLLQHGAVVDAPSRSGATAFYRAVRQGSVSIMTLLKDAGANIDVRTWDQWTPVFEAVRLRRLDVLRLLLQWGADPNVPTATGQTPLLVAEGHADLVHLLTNEGRAIQQSDAKLSLPRPGERYGSALSIGKAHCAQEPR